FEGSAWLRAAGRIVVKVGSSTELVLMKAVTPEEIPLGDTIRSAANLNGTVAPVKWEPGAVAAVPRTTVRVVPLTPVTSMVSESIRIGKVAVVGKPCVEATAMEVWVLSA